ncbi:6,7-dimethyl-8-ribityllumazine synthase [bacterium]|nr:6,7-dimethyl-8-ribityllumazine synthase [bacterium]
MSLSEATKVFERFPDGIDAKALKSAADGLRRVAILKTFWYPEIIEAMERSARSYLADLNVGSDRIEAVGVPGSFELPLAVKLLAESKSYDIVIALGCVLRGGTPHFDYVCRETIAGLSQVSLAHNLPLGMGVLTVDSLEQAQERMNKGLEAAQAAVLMWTLKGKMENAK